LDCEGVICRTTRGFALLDSCTPSVELLPLALPHEQRIHPDAQIAVALGRTVYLWNAGSGAVEELCSCANEADYICSVAWSGDGSYLALGTSDAKVRPLNTLARHLAVALLCSIHVTRAKCGFVWLAWQVQIWDAGRAKQIRELNGHTNRVSSVAWNNSMLSSGGRDSAICNWDVRKRRDEACVATVVSHEQVFQLLGSTVEPEQTYLPTYLLGCNRFLTVHSLLRLGG
jgi:WD40 repeat protein